MVPGSLELSFVEGGKYFFCWPTAGQCKGRFQKLIPNKLIQFSWIKSHAKYSADEFETLVTVDLDAVESCTRFTLIHSGFRQKEAFESHAEGWKYVLEALLANVSG